ncbi:hypothetical protein Ahu01nite_044610 [Winogradskya humida]|uniref:Uncharacterized protein n=1 Tax=Winogradskya humida TaxID=113566 RepID=A0ABQ3ZS22_9ACTN|nr:hypothetical protein Ahu01nite_044610 [Actinoplanes humidus]
MHSRPQVQRDHFGVVIHGEQTGVDAALHSGDRALRHDQLEGHVRSPVQGALVQDLGGDAELPGDRMQREGLILGRRVQEPQGGRDDVIPQQVAPPTLVATTGRVL